MATAPIPKLVDPISSPEWRSLVETTSSSLFHSPVWMRVINETYGTDMSAAIIERDGAPVAGVAWSESNDLIGRKRITLPYSDFCDVLGDDENDRLALARSVIADDLPWVVRTFDGNLPGLRPNSEAMRHFKWHGLDVTPDEDSLLAAMTSNSRRGIRKAERSGVEIRQAESKADLREWFLLHLRLRKYKHHLLAQPFSFFERMWDLLIDQGDGFLLMAFHEGKLLGGTLYLTWGDTCYYKYNASDHGSLNLRPNNLLTWAGALEAKRRGLKILDFGRSSASQQGLIDYKAGFGAKERDIYAHLHLTDGVIEEKHEDSEDTLSKLTGLFISPEVSDEITEKAGALLYRFFK